MITENKSTKKIKEVVPQNGKELSMKDYILIAKKAFERFSD